MGVDEEMNKVTVLDLRAELHDDRDGGDDEATDDNGGRRRKNLTKKNLMKGKAKAIPPPSHDVSLVLPLVFPYLDARSLARVGGVSKECHREVFEGHDALWRMHARARWPSLLDRYLVAAPSSSTDGEQKATNPSSSTMAAGAASTSSSKSTLNNKVPHDRSWHAFYAKRANALMPESDDHQERKQSGTPWPDEKDAEEWQRLVQRYVFTVEVYDKRAFTEMWEVNKSSAGDAQKKKNVQRELNRLSHSVEGNDEAPQPIFTTSMNFETCLGGEGNVALYPNAAAEALIDMDDLPLEDDDDFIKYISSDHITFVISLEDTVTGVVRRLGQTFNNLTDDHHRKYCHGRFGEDGGLFDLAIFGMSDRGCHVMHANFGLHARPSCVSHDNDDCECNKHCEARQIKLLCGLVAKAEGSDMHAPDDGMYRQMVLDNNVQAQNFVEKLLTPDDKCRLVLNLRFAPPMCVDGFVVSVLEDGTVVEYLSEDREVDDCRDLVYACDTFLKFGTVPGHL